MSEVTIKKMEVFDQPNEKMNYVQVMFEDRYNSTEENPKFYGKTYLYKTKQDLKEGQVLKINTRYGTSKVVVYENCSEERAEKIANEAGYTLDRLEEI